MVLQLKGAVGRPSAAGVPAPNHMMDQQLVSELLDAGWHPPMVPLEQRLPPIQEGVASEMLCDEIARFQSEAGLAIVDGRCSVGWDTWNALVERAEAAMQAPLPPPIVLSLNDYEVHALPRLASGLPSMTFTIQGIPNVLYGPGYTIELSVRSGSLKVDWGNALPFAVAADPQTASLQTKVENGTAQTTPGVTLAEESAKLQVESRIAIGTLFAGVKLGLDAVGSPTLGGSIGDTEGFTSVSWDPVGRAAVFHAERKIFQVVTTSFGAGATVTVTGRLILELKVKTEQGDDPASVLAHLAVVLPALYFGGVTIVAAIEVAGPAAVWAITRLGSLLKAVPAPLRFVPQ